MTAVIACAGGAGRVQAASAGPADKADKGFSENFVKTGMPQQQLVADTIPITGKLALDKQQTRIAAARVAGRLGRIFVFEGQSVHAGDTLAEIYSPDYISGENEYLLAKRFHDTLSAASADADLRTDADLTLRSAANKLKVLGASAADIAALGRHGTIAEYLLVRAPISGVVTQRNVDPGGYLNVGDALMSLANLDTLWLFANTYDADYQYLKLGELLGRATGPVPGAAVALAAASAVFLVFPNWVGGHFKAHPLNHALRYQAELREDVSAIIGKAGGAKKVLACGSIETENFQVPMVAWYLDIEANDITDQLPTTIANRGTKGDSPVILQARDTGTAALQPKVPKNKHYTEIKQRTFNLFEHCR